MSTHCHHALTNNTLIRISKEGFKEEEGGNFFFDLFWIHIDIITTSIDLRNISLLKENDKEYFWSLAFLIILIYYESYLRFTLFCPMTLLGDMLASVLAL